MDKLLQLWTQYGKYPRPNEVQCELVDIKRSEKQKLNNFAQAIQSTGAPVNFPKRG